MLLALIHAKATSRALTCSEVMAILMDQPTASGESHAHMHTNEGFTLVDQATFAGNGDPDTYEKKKLQWENPTHLYPQLDIFTHTHSERVRGFSYGRIVDARPAGGYDGVYQDPARIAQDRSYLNRGLPALPAVTETTHEVFQFPTPMGKPTPRPVTLTEITQLRTGTHPTLRLGRGAGLIQPVSGSTTEPMVRENTVIRIPLVRASAPHSMFSDSESMIMHLTAALMSDAGLEVLDELVTRTRPGEQKTVGIFSKTAVAAVSAVAPSVPTVLINRTMQHDPSIPRTPSGYPVSGDIVTTQHAIDHVVVVLGHRATGEMNVITCFPSTTTTLASIGTATGPGQDIAELQYTRHTVVTQRSPLPRLTW